LDQVLNDSRRATIAAQTSLDSAATEGDRVAIQNLMTRVRTDIARQSSSSLIAGFRVDQSPSAIAPQDFTAGGLEADMISPGLREQVILAPETQWWQSVALPGVSGGDVAGIIVGQVISVPEVGPYE